MLRAAGERPALTAAPSEAGPAEPCRLPAGPASKAPREARAEPEPATPAPALPEPLLDPMARALAQPLARGPEPPAPAPLAAAPDELLLERVVKRLSWGGSGKRGTARIELAAGSLAGATLLVHAEGREITLEADGADAQALAELAARLAKRLDEKGITLRQA